MNRKAALAWETIGKLLIGLLLVVIILGIIYASKGQFSVLLAKIQSILRFGA